MLLLTRRPNEEIIIGNNISIRILDINGFQVRIGIEAPKDVKIYRREILDRPDFKE